MAGAPLTSSAVDRLRARLAQDERRREIGPGTSSISSRSDRGFEKARQPSTPRRGVRRDVGRHADRDAAGAVDEQVREARRKHLRLVARAVIIGREIDRVLVEILEQGHRHLGEARLGVPHRGGRIGVHRAEIALAVDQRHPHRPVLGHPRQRVVDRAVAVRVVLAHDVADDLGRLAIGAAGDEAAFLAGVEDAAVDRLQSVAHGGKRAADDHRHGVIEVAGLHLLDDGDGGNVAVIMFVGGRLGRQGGSCRFCFL